MAQKQDNGNHAHTPGPWMAYAPFEQPENDSENWEVHDGYGRTATVYGENNSEDRANARLIAAAPELLEALEALVNRMDKGFVPSRILLFRSRAAIAKAKGESQ